MDRIMAISDRDFGNLESKVHSIEEDMGEVKKDVKAILGKMSNMDGSWKALLGVAAVASALGGVIVKILPVSFHL
jgi:hypothetical protein